MFSLYLYRKWLNLILLALCNLIHHCDLKIRMFHRHINGVYFLFLSLKMKYFCRDLPSNHRYYHYFCFCSTLFILFCIMLLFLCPCSHASSIYGFFYLFFLDLCVVLNKNDFLHSCLIYISILLPSL